MKSCEIFQSQNRTLFKLHPTTTSDANFAALFTSAEDKKDLHIRISNLNESEITVLPHQCSSYSNVTVLQVSFPFSQLGGTSMLTRSVRPAVFDQLTQHRCLHIWVYNVTMHDLKVHCLLWTKHSVQFAGEKKEQYMHIGPRFINKSLFFRLQVCDVIQFIFSDISVNVTVKNNN